MSRGANAVLSGKQLVDRVVAYSRSLGLYVRTEVPCGRRLWGAQRYIDIVVTTPLGQNQLGIECKWQSQSGSAEEKLLGTLQDIDSWGFPGLLVYEGPGFSRGITSYLSRHTKAVSLADLPALMQRHFGIAPSSIVLHLHSPSNQLDLF